VPDISLCTNSECPLAKSCKRMLAAPSDVWQSYTAFVYDEGCDNYIEWYTKDVD